MIIQQWHPATTTRHSYTLIYQFLTDLQMFVYRPRVALRYSVWTSSYFQQLTSYDNNYVCHECICVTEVSMGTQKFWGALHVPVAEHPFLNF